LVIHQCSFSATAEFNKEYSNNSKPKSLENDIIFLSPKWIIGSLYSIFYKNSNRMLSEGLNFSNKKLARSYGVMETVYNLFSLYSNMVSSRRLKELFRSVA
jgi:hypothetical protein